MFLPLADFSKEMPRVVAAPFQELNQPRRTHIAAAAGWPIEEEAEDGDANLGSQSANLDKYSPGAARGSPMRNCLSFIRCCKLWEKPMLKKAAGLVRELLDEARLQNGNLPRA